MSDSPPGLHPPTGTLLKARDLVLRLAGQLHLLRHMLLQPCAGRGTFSLNIPQNIGGATMSRAIRLTDLCLKRAPLLLPSASCQGARVQPARNPSSLLPVYAHTCMHVPVCIFDTPQIWGIFCRTSNATTAPCRHLLHLQDGDVPDRLLTGTRQAALP